MDVLLGELMPQLQQYPNHQHNLSKSPIYTLVLE